MNMRNTLLTYIDRFMHDRHSRKVLGSVLLVLAIVVSLTVYWQLRLHGIAITNETYCGYEEHVHTEECYETTLICGLEETVGLTSDWHAHDESCYDEEGNLVCELEECEPHTHTDECYETTLICEIPEHTHTTDCLVDLEADVEDATVWEATLPELTGDLRADIVNIAYSQLGYTESTANYTLAEDGTTKMGYTRYGAWYGGLYYGSEYSDWDSLFVAFCLDYAGIADDFTYNSGAYAWSVDLTTLGYYQTADSYAPSIGDVAFIDTDADGRANITAIVVSIDETAQTITVIQGNYTVTDTEGDSTDTVAVVTYSTAADATQNEIVILSAGSEAEITPVILGYANVTYTAETIEEIESKEVVAEETDSEEVTEEVAEEVTVDETEADETEIEEAEETEEETVLLTTASAVLTYDEYCSEAYSLYTYAMSVTDSTAAASAWSALMSVWDEIDDAYADGTLTVEEYESLNDIMYAYYDEVYAYYTESVGYDPYGVMTAEDEGEEDDDGSEETGTLTSSSSWNLKDYSSVVWTYNSASYSDDKFSISFHIDFSSLAISNINSGTTFYLNLPTGVTVPDSYKYTNFNGYDNSGKKVFTYTFAYDENTETWQIVITFDESYNDTSEGTIDGYVDFSGTYVLQGSDVDANGNVVISGTDTGNITIEAEDITTSDNENWLADIKVEKSSSTGYNTSTKSITYTVVVSSENGTDGEEITLDDVIKIVNNSSYSNTGVSVESVEINRVTYYTDYYSGYYDTSTGTTLESGDYSNYSTDTELSLVLPALNGLTESSPSNATGDCYVIVYTVTFKTDSSEYNSSITNTATATSETSAGDITYSAEVTKNAIDSSIKKTGVYDSTDNKIYWTITFNSSHSNIANYTISDAMLSQMVDGSLNVSYTTTDSTTSVDAVADTDYSISGGTITFLPVDDTVGDDDVADSNTYAYTITYTTDADASLGSTGYTSRNTVTVNNDENKEQAKEYGDVWVGTGGSLQKALSSTEKADETTETRVLNWTTTVTVPAGGITSGTVLCDYLGVSSGDKSSFDDDDATSVTKQWFTYTQINTLFSGLTTYGIKIGDYTVNYEVISGEGEDAVYSFTLEAYDVTAGAWVSYANISDNGDLYTAYSITFNKDVEYSGTWTISYSTTANISDVLNYTLTSEYYNNRVEIGSLSADAGYTEQSLVYKTDGKYNFENSNVTVDDTGTLTWIVNVYITPGSTETYTVVDTLPTGLTFDSAKVSINWDSVTLTDGNMSGYFGWINTDTEITGTVTGNSTEGTVVTINIEPAHYSCINTSGGYVTITYTAHITDFDTSNPGTLVEGSTTQYSVGSYKNSVEVKYDNADYGKDDQTQTVTYTKAEEGGSTSSDDHDVVEKSGSYNGDDATLRYSVLLNLDADDIDESEGGDHLTFTDTASHYYTSDSNANWHTSLLSLQDATVTFYKLTKLELIGTTTGSNDVTYYNYGYYTYTYDDSGEITSTTSTILVTLGSEISQLSDTDLDSASIYKYTESDGTYAYYYKEKITVNWTYSATTNASVVGGSGNYYYTITATVPDETAILVEYWYNISASAVGNGFEIGNSATLSYDGTTAGSDGNTEQDKWENPTTTGGVTSGSGITVYKVATGSYSTTLPGATFEMWKYDTTQGKWVQVTYTDFSSGYTDITSPSTSDQTNTGTNPMTTDNYLVTGANGTITITNKFEYEKDSYAYYDWFEEDTLYYIVEVSAPDGYELITQQKIYFYWSGSETLTYPSDVDTSSVTVYDLNSTSINPTVHIENQPNTTFTLTKVSSTDTGLTLAGATFALYEFHDDSDVTAAEGTWTRIGTYVTDDNGEITITFNSNIYTFNHAYKLVEESSPDDYNIAYNDDAAFYFYWGSSDNTTYPPVLPSDWASGTTGTSASEALNIATSDGEVTATNTKNTTTIAVKKAWVDEAGNDLSEDSYSATVQLYYYLADKNGNPIRNTSSTAKYITLSSSTSDTTAEIYSKTLSYPVELGAGWASITEKNDVSGLWTAIDDDSYDDAYVEVVVAGGAKPSSMTMIIQSSSNVEVSPSSVEQTSLVGVTPYYTVRYSVADIKKALDNAGVTLTAQTGLCFTGNNYGGTVQSISVVGNADYAVSPATVSAALDGNSTWASAYYKDTTASSKLQEGGAVVAVTYSNVTTSGNVRIGVQFDKDNDGNGDTGYYKTVTVSDTSGTIYALVSDMTDDSGNSIPDNIDWSTYFQTYVQLYNSDFAGTIDTISILVPSESTTSTTYEIAATATSPAATTGNGSATLTSDWTTYLTGDTDAASALATDGALIYITYTCGDSVPSYVNVGVQYNASGSWGNAGSTPVYSVSSGTGTITVPVSSILDSSYSSDNYNAIYLQVGSDSYNLTVTSVQVLVPYSADTSISPDLSSNVVLYNPSTSSYNASLQYGSYQYNALSSREDEDKTAEYDDSNITDRDSVVFTGYGFLDAVYSDVAEYVEITLKDVYINYSNSGNLSDSLKSYLRLIIQGDLSSDYDAILSVAPADVVKNDDGTYTVYYSTSAITQALANAGNEYESAAEAYADYNSLVLAYSHNEAFSATVTDLQVTGTVTSYYSYGDLVGTYSGGQEYTTTDDSGGTVEYVYTLNSKNDWSVAIANLPLSYTDADGTVYYYEYYFVETGSITGVESKYTVYTTYSQTEGENGGGEIVVVNTLVETTEITVEKSWVDESGNSLDDSPSLSDANVTFDLYYYLAYTDTDGTVHYYNDGSSTSSDDDDDDSGDSGGGTTGTTVADWTEGALVYLGSDGSSRPTDMSGTTPTVYIPYGASVTVTIDSNSTDTYDWYGAYGYEEANYSGKSLDEDYNTGNGATVRTFSFSTTTTYPYYIIAWTAVDGETLTISFIYDGSTYTKTRENGSWSEGWTVTETASANAAALSTSTSATAAMLLAAVDEPTVTALSLSANATDDTATIYFGSSSNTYNVYTSLDSVPLGTDITVTITNETNSYTWYALYGYTADNTVDDSWSGYEYTWYGGTPTWTYDSTTLSGTFTTDSSHPYYMVSYTSATGETLTVSYTYNNVEYTLTGEYSDTEGKYVWETTTSGGTTDPGGSTGTDTDASSATSYYVGEYTIVYDGNSDGTMDWSTVISELPVYEIIGTTQYTRYYYVVETGTSVTIAGDTPLYESAEYTNNDGITSGTITITNTVDETAIAYVMPSTTSFDYTTMYEFGIMLILLSLVGAGTYRNISRIRKSLVEEPHRDGVDPGGTHERLPDVRNRKFVTHRHPRKGDTRAGPDG